MLDRRTATWAELRERKEVHDANFLAGRIGEPTYLLTIQILFGFTEKQAEAELRDLKLQHERRAPNRV